MKDERNLEIAKILDSLNSMIERNQAEEVVAILQQFVSSHPEWVDERFEAEVKLVTTQMETQKLLTEWSYFRAMHLVYQYCEKKYAKQLTNYSYDDKETVDLPDKNVIWWCWLQGIDRAPDIVQACYHSLEKLGRPIMVLTDDNMSSYIQLPDWIEEKYRKGIINRTHYSDLVRIELLTTRGGTWIDSTVFCSDSKKISNLLASSDIFMYSFVMRDSVNRYMMFDSWLMHVNKPSKLLQNVKEMLFTYWKEENELKHYFLFHIFLTISCRLNEEESRSIPVFSYEPCHILQRELFKPFTSVRWEQIKGMSDIHKLTYKVSTENDIRGTFWEYILSGST